MWAMGPHHTSSDGKHSNDSRSRLYATGLGIRPTSVFAMQRRQCLVETKQCVRRSRSCFTRPHNRFFFASLHNWKYGRVRSGHDSQFAIRGAIRAWYSRRSWCVLWHTTTVVTCPVHCNHVCKTLAQSFVHPTKSFYRKQTL